MDSGLEGVIAAETRLSHSDGERGIRRGRRSPRRLHPVFAIGRCAGWLAYAMEQQKPAPDPAVVGLYRLRSGVRQQPRVLNPSGELERKKS